MRSAARAWVPLLAGALALAACHAMGGNRAVPPPVTFTAEQDHSNMMEQLGITALRPGVSGDENDPDHANYDELLANPYPKPPEAARAPARSAGAGRQA